MIDLYSGTPGSGKSLHIAEKIYYRLRLKNRLVICNFPINEDKIKNKKGKFVYIPNDQMTPQKLADIAIKYWNGHQPIEDYILLVIDECQIVFNAREWAKKGRSDWLSFFTQHRKLGYHVILAAQFDQMVDKQIRSLIEYNYVHRKVSNFGLAGMLISAFALGNLFVSVKVWYPMNEKIGSEFFQAKKKFYSLYDTYAIFNGEDNKFLLTSTPK